MAATLQSEIADTQQLLSQVSGSQYEAIRDAQCASLLVKVGNCDEVLEPKTMSALCETINKGAWTQNQKDKLYTAVTKLGHAASAKKKGGYKPQVLKNFPSFLSQNRHSVIADPRVPVEKKLDEAALQLVLLECCMPHEKETYGPALQYILTKSGCGEIDDGEKLRKLDLFKSYVKTHAGQCDACKPVHLYIGTASLCTMPTPCITLINIATNCMNNTMSI